MRFSALTLEQLKLELEQAFDAARSPQSPTPVFTEDEANLPPPADFKDCVLLVRDLNILAHSDGSDWIRQDTGAAI